MEAEKKKNSDSSAILKTIQSRSPNSTISKGGGASKLRSSSTSVTMKSRRESDLSSILPRVHRRQNHPGRSSISMSLR